MRRVHTSKVYKLPFGKWTRRDEFKSWTRQIAFHIALIPLGKVWIQLFSLQLCVNSRADWGSSALVRQLVNEKENSEFKSVKPRLKNWPCVQSCPSRGVGKKKGIARCAISSKEMDTATRVQILDETDCISHSTDTLGKGMNPIILPLVMDK